MEPSTLERLRKELEDDRRQHMEMLQEYGADPYTDEVGDLQVGTDSFADSGAATEERSEKLGQIDAARVRVQQIDRALEQMDDGSYGTCEVCGETIAQERLEVRPLSTKCVSCASQS